jgi:repressor LexA
LEKDTNILVGARLEKIIEHYKMTTYEFSKLLGFDRADKIYNILKGKFNPSFEILVAITNKFVDVNIDWLINGKGEMLRIEILPSEQIEGLYQDRAIAVGSLSSDIGSYRKIPLVEVAAVAGFGNARFAIGESDVKEWYIVPKFKDRKIDFMIEVSGSSMYPKYNSGDVVACTILRESQFIQWNKVHIIGTEEQGILIKRIKKGQDENHMFLISDNKDYDPFAINLKEVTGMALVVGVIRLE